eukprot:gene3505-4005_t
MVFWWLGYDWWGAEESTGDNGDKSDKSDATATEREKEDWIWIDHSDNVLKQSDLDFFERCDESNSEEPLREFRLSYADAVRASFERCKKGSSENYSERNKTTIDGSSSWNLAKVKLLPQGFNDYSANEKIPTKRTPATEFDRKRKNKNLRRYQPFPKQGRLSITATSDSKAYCQFNFLEKEFLAPFKFPFDQNEMKKEPQHMTIISSHDDKYGWKTVERGLNRRASNTKFANAFKANRFAVDVSNNEFDMNICLLRMRCLPEDLVKTTKKDEIMKNCCTVVEDVRIPIRDINKGSNHTICVRKDLKKMITLRIKKSNEIKWRAEKKDYLIPSRIKKTTTLQNNAVDIRPLRYLLGLEKQPLCIEWKMEREDESINTLSQGRKFIEHIFNGLFCLALSISGMDVTANNYQILSVPEIRGTNQNEVSNQVKSRQIRISRRGRRSRCDSKWRLELKTQRQIAKGAIPKSRLGCMKKANMVKFRQAKHSSKSRNFTAQKFSGRSGVRAC